MSSENFIHQLIFNALNPPMEESDTVKKQWIQLELPLRHYPPKKVLKTQLDAVVFFMHTMDVPMMDQLIDDDSVFSEISNRKYFFEVLQSAFDRFRKAGDSYLKTQEGFCNTLSCNYLKKGFRFVGNLSEMWMDIIFEHQQGVLTEIYSCHFFTTHTEVNLKGKNLEVSFVKLPDIDEDEIDWEI